MGFKLIKPNFMWICVFVAVSLIQFSLANNELEEDKPKRQERFFGSLFGGFGGGGPAPLPGDITSPVVCERYCRNRCLNGGYSGYLGVPGCNQYCDCSYYLGRPFG